MHGPLDGAWMLQSGQPLPNGVRDIKIISDGRFMFAAYDEASGEPSYAAGGSCVLEGDAYTEHMEFATGRLAELIGEDQAFTVELDGDTFTQRGTLSNGRPLSEVWKRLD